MIFYFPKIKVNDDRLCWTALASLIPWFVVNNYFSSAIDSKFICNLFSIGGLVGAFVLSIVVPYYLAVSRSVSLLPRSSSVFNIELDHLESILRNKDGFEAYRKFLTSEFSVENLYFWLEIEKFRDFKEKSIKHYFGLMNEKSLGGNFHRKSADAVHSPIMNSFANVYVQGDAKHSMDNNGVYDPRVINIPEQMNVIRELCTQIHNKYICPGSPYQVNLPSGIYDSLQNQLAQNWQQECCLLKEDCSRFYSYFCEQVEVIQEKQVQSINRKESSCLTTPSLDSGHPSTVQESALSGQLLISDTADTQLNSKVGDSTSSILKSQVFSSSELKQDFDVHFILLDQMSSSNIVQDTVLSLSSQSALKAVSSSTESSTLCEEKLREGCSYLPGVVTYSSLLHNSDVQDYQLSSSDCTNKSVKLPSESKKGTSFSQLDSQSTTYSSYSFQPFVDTNHLESEAPPSLLSLQNLASSMKVKPSDILSKQTAVLVMASVENLPWRSVYDEAQRSILQLMENDSFIRFRGSNGYLELVELHKNRRREKQILDSANFS